MFLIVPYTQTIKALLPDMDTALAFNQLHDGAVAHGRCQCAVAGEERCIKGLRQGDVSGVISRDVAAQFPDTIEEWPVA
jgi:hypothetical protein